MNAARHGERWNASVAAMYLIGVLMLLAGVSLVLVDAESAKVSALMTLVFGLFGLGLLWKGGADGSVQRSRRKRAEWEQGTRAWAVAAFIWITFCFAGFILGAPTLVTVAACVALIFICFGLLSAQSLDH